MKLESTEELWARLLADEQVHSMIAMRAYEIFLLRGGAPGHEAEDWFRAEAEILKFVIEEEVRRSEASAFREEPAAVERATPPSRLAAYDASEKRMEVFISVETDAVPAAEPAAQAASAGGGGSKKAPTPAKTASPEAPTKPAAPSKKTGGRLKPPKGLDKKASGKVKAPKKAAGKTKQSKQRSSEMEKHK